MKPQIQTDVVIVGAGPIGLTLANLLANLGVRTILAERAATVSDEPRAISITDESLRVMQQLGIMDRLAPEMLMDTGARYFGRNGQLLAEVRARQPRLGQPAKSQFDQPVLAQLLLEAALSRPLATVCFNTEARHVVSDRDGARLELASQGQVQAVNCKWVIACDGGRSSTRTQLGITLEGSTQVERWIVIDVVNSRHAPTPYSQFHCNGKRPCVVVPGVKGRCRYEFMLMPHDDPEAVLEPDSVIRLVAPYQVIDAGDIRRAAVYVAQQRIAQTYRKGRVLLAGDAAHLMPPFAGQGLNAGVRDAANLGWKLAASVRGEAPDALLDTYEQERRPHAAEMVRLSYRIGKVVMSTSPMLTALRDWSISALGLVPAAKAWIVGMRFLRQPHHVHGCVRPPSNRVPPAVARLVGKALAQPRVRTERDQVCWLDSLLGPEWATVHFRTDGWIEVAHRTLPAPAVVQDADGLFDDVSASGAVLLVRPDRYVAAAAADREELPHVIAGLDGLLPHLGEALGMGKPRRPAPAPQVGSALA
ncbi:bifunctional 3-(3-hydroxy-phenyl)propionate/3-hydroxycinnamic acid hydroxylase [Variovorax boronicumulans]|uniref:bifunctional 3-(3-hydroxy-phenyl)propionate/3-hydroxycinnamic acid hydroxylase n=1 Tax=Variovorax boronicumulans TaxID=436515 RepID=UPI002787AEE4|nr:bifunctional 3-(3-hydroxy-phenyl)propionate/3-hydroxycinnamic acid hydroxylase [Variovorax boronicumulans]MDQ0044572.1 3-(3-hydroxy-phenyl)propionate hydroxylase [Variovorax boronicumulans]